MLSVIQSTSEKETYLKDLVIKLLQERNLSNFDMLDSLFAEVKQELQNQQKKHQLNHIFVPNSRREFFVD